MTRRKTAFLAAALLAAGCAQDPEKGGRAGAAVPGQGDYGGVERSDLIGSHVARATGANTARFRWEFTETEFKASSESGALPPEVTDALLGAATEPKRRNADDVRGTWALDGGRLVLTDIRWTETTSGSTTPDEQSAPDVSLAPFKTPVVRFEFGPTQYVLGPAKR